MQRLRHIKLFEEFNPYTGMQFAEKLVIYAKASESVTKVTAPRREGNLIVFTIVTNIPGDYNSGDKEFRVNIPVDASKVYVEQIESGKIVLKVTLEPDGENDINNILVNFIEATSIFDDSSVDNIVSAYKKVRTPEDIKRIISTEG